MSTNQKIEELIRLLIKGTEGGTLKWEQSAAEDTFRLSSRTANVRITREERGVIDVSRRLSVIGDVGRVIDEYSPTALAEMEEFDKLFYAARRSASNTDEVIDKLMKELAKGAP